MLVRTCQHTRKLIQTRLCLPQSWLSAVTTVVITNTTTSSFSFFAPSSLTFAAFIHERMRGFIYFNFSHLSPPPCNHTPQRLPLFTTEQAGPKRTSWLWLVSTASSSKHSLGGSWQLISPRRTPIMMVRHRSRVVPASLFHPVLYFFEGGCFLNCTILGRFMSHGRYADL